MSLFGNNCGYSNNSCGLFGGNDTILWFIILVLLIFCNGCGDNNRGTGCGCDNDCC